MAKEGGAGPGEAARLLKALGLSLGIWALCTLLVLAPPVGPVLLFTFAPFIAGYYGAKKGALRARRGWLALGLGAGLIWSVVETAALLALLGSILGTVDPFEPIGLCILAGLFLANLLFCCLGARRGSGEGTGAT